VQERLQKIVARAGIASRRKADEMVQQGRVSVNGVTLSLPGSKADLSRDDVRVDGVRLRASRERVYLVLNKPKGVVSTRRDPQRRPTVMSLVPHVPGLFPVGRLDVTTEGLILLTNDGAFAERVAHPRYEVPRVYLAKVRGVPGPETLARLRRGVSLNGERLVADNVRVVKAENNAWLEVTVHEGRNHEVRRLLEAVGHPVSKLKRIALGPVSAKGLASGAYRALAPHEVRGLLGGHAPSRRAPGRLRRPERPRPAPRT
jgi:23S rRNA pseudouridine2605 synthase